MLIEEWGEGRHGKKQQQKTNTMANKVSRRVRVLKLTPSAVGFHTVERYLAKVHKALRNFVECNRNGKQAKIQLKLRLEMFKYAPENKVIKYNSTFATVMMVVQSRNQTSKVLKKLYHSLTSNVEAFIRMGSGWTVNRIIFLEIQLVKCKKYVGGSRVNTTDLPPEIQGKKAVLNVKGAPKDWCFHYAVAASLLDFPPEKHPERAYHYRTMVAELEKVCTPMTIDNIPKFERKNRVRVDVFEWNNTKKKAGLLYKSQGKSGPLCRVLLYQNQYYPVRNMNKLFCYQNKGIRYICGHCYAYFSTKPGRQRHEKSCENQGKMTYLMPVQEDTVFNVKSFGKS